MRITNKMITNTYMINLNNSYTRMNKLNEKTYTGRKYLKASEDPATALKAYQVRQSLSKIELYKNNVSEVKGLFTEVETAVSNVNSILGEVMEQLIQARGTTSQGDLNAIGQVIRNYQGQILSISNSNFAGRYIFGGNNMKNMPFTLDASGNLQYQAMDVNNNTPFPKEEQYYDIGLGLATDGAGNILAGTALNIASPGSEFFGTGVDADGFSNNVYNLLGQIAQLLEDGNVEDLGKIMNKLEERNSEVLLDYVSIGQRSNFIEFLAKRFDVDETNALEKQQRLEGIDPAKAIIEFNMQELSYKAALQMGAKIIQPSLLDYLR